VPEDYNGLAASFRRRLAAARIRRFGKDYLTNSSRHSADSHIIDTPAGFSIRYPCTVGVAFDAMLGRVMNRYSHLILQRREEAKRCLRIAKTLNKPDDQRLLEEMSRELLEEADRMAVRRERFPLLLRNRK
jgi:hypothetical protein